MRAENNTVFHSPKRPHFRAKTGLGLDPDYSGKYFIKRSAVHNKNTRGCNNFVVPRCRLLMGQRAFYFRGPREWNGLAYNIKNSKDMIVMIVLSGHFLSIFFIRNNLKCILNLIKPL